MENNDQPLIGIAVLALICVAAFPADVTAPVQYGKNFRALLAYLYDAQQGASLRIGEMCAEMFGYAVSEATLQRARQ